jgi:ribonuclease P protein component
VQSRHRLKENRDFRRVFQRGKSVATAKLVLYCFENRINTFRIGFSISKKVGNAVVRNHLKRLLRACFQRHLEDLVDLPYDMVVVCRKSAAEADFDELENEVLKLLRRAKIMV